MQNPIILLKFLSKLLPTPSQGIKNDINTKKKTADWTGKKCKNYFCFYLFLFLLVFCLLLDHWLPWQWLVQSLALVFLVPFSVGCLWDACQPLPFLSSVFVPLPEPSLHIHKMFLLQPEKKINNNLKNFLIGTLFEQ